MTKFKAQGLNNTFKNAGKGIRIVLKSENNIRVHFFVAIFVIVLGLVLDLSVAKLCILLKGQSTQCKPFRLLFLRNLTGNQNQTAQVHSKNRGFCDA